MGTPGNPAPPPRLPRGPGLSLGRAEILRTFRYLFGHTAWEGKEQGVIGNIAGAKETPNSTPQPVLGPKHKLLPSPHSIYGAVAT